MYDTHTDLRRQIGPILRRYRLERCLTYQQLSEVTDVCITTLSRIEKGSVPHELTIAKLIKKLPDLFPDKEAFYEMSYD